MKLTKLKRVAVLRAGGTPAVQAERFWREPPDGTPWVAIGDMSEGGLVSHTTRHVSAEGIADKHLPVGSPGTVLFAMYASLGAAAELAVEASWNQALLGIEPMPGVSERRFIRYWLEHLQPSLGALARSNTQDNLNAEQVGNLDFPVLSPETQRAIADYLDTETNRIDTLITKKRRMIELLGQRWDTWLREAIRSTTCPVLPLKRKWRVTDCKHRTPTYVDDGYPVISPGDVTPGRLDLARAHRFVDETDFRDLAADSRRPRRGDIIYSRNASIGIASYVDTDAPFTMGQDVCLITSDDMDQLYLMYVLNSIGVDQLEAQKVGSTFSRVNVAQILELEIPVPDSLEQRSLGRGFDDAAVQLSRACAALDQQADLLVERRQALITAAVTGELSAGASRGRAG